jgi:hypothetical protein
MGQHYRHDLVAHAFYRSATPDAIMQRLAFYRLDSSADLQIRDGVALVPVGPYIAVSAAHTPDIAAANIGAKARAADLGDPEPCVFVEEPERLELREWLRSCLFAGYQTARGRYWFHREPVQPFVDALRSYPQPDAPPPVPPLLELIDLPKPRTRYKLREQQEQAVRLAKGLPLRSRAAPVDRPFYGSMESEHAWSAKDTAAVRAAMAQAELKQPGGFWS